MCRRLERVVWKNIYKFGGLNEAERLDIFASVFFRLFTHIHTIKQPERIPGWVATTARRESLQLLRRRGRETPSEVADDAVATDGPVDEQMLADERHAAVRRALPLLTPQCRDLLGLWSAGAPQAQIVVELDMAQGSIGPTVRRCLDKLKSLLGGEP